MSSWRGPSTTTTWPTSGPWRTPAHHAGHGALGLSLKSFWESSRDQVADIGGKLAAFGRRLAPEMEWEAGPVAFIPEEVEVLGRLQHESWMRRLLANGWRFAAGPRDPKRKTHPDFVPFDELPEEKKEYDQDTVQSIPAFLARV